MNVCEQLVRLIRNTSSRLPDDVLTAVKKAVRRELPGSPAAVVLRTILDNCALAAERGTPLCQDTGTLAFYVDEHLRRRVTPAVIARAVARATALGYLRKNCIDSVTGVSYDDNVAAGAPVIHYETDLVPGSVTLLLKGGGSENMSRQYSLPDATIGAGRDLAGVRKCVLDAVREIQGYGCAPGILGVCIGGDRASAYEAAKRSLLRRVGERSKGKLGALERQLLKEANALGVGPMGLGGATTLLDVHLTALPRVPASFFVTIAYMCWACRRRTILFAN